MGSQLGTIVIVEKDDSFASTRSKMAGAGSRIGLVIPRDCRALYRSLAFKMLRRWTEGCGVQVTIISRDPPLKRLCQEFGLPICPSVRKIEAHWRREDAIRQASPAKAWFLRLQGPFIRLVTTLLVFTVLLGGAAYFALPVATVSISPVNRAFSERIVITADPMLAARDSAGLRIPARVVTTTIEKTDRVPATGKKEGQAKGFVTFANMSDSEVRLPKGTVVTTADKRRFETVGDIVLPSPRWTSVRAEVVATEVGPKGEAGRGRPQRATDRCGQGPAADYGHGRRSRQAAGQPRGSSGQTGNCRTHGANETL
jgi:hypothetical protein